MSDMKAAIVTGGASGIGRATAMGFARRGDCVQIIDRDEAGGEATAALIRNAGGKAVFFAADITDRSSAFAMVQHCIDQFGSIDWAVNAAGHPGRQAPFVEWDEEITDLAFSVNTRGAWLCMVAEIGAMLDGRGGGIVNIASMGGVRGSATFSGYCASKAALINYTQSAAVEHAAHGIRTNVICPGPIHTPMLDATMEYPGQTELVARSTPMGRIGEAEEVANCALFLCSDAASYVNGVVLPVDGGLSA